MSAEAAKDARAAMKAKAKRMVTTDPHQKVDASGWTPPEPLNTEAKTGMRPVSRRQFKSGGAVDGDAAASRADRKPRESGGRALTANSLINRDEKEANEERDGVKHVGGFARGGVPTGGVAQRERARKMYGTGLPALTSVSDGEIQGARPTGGRMARAEGGRTGKGMNVNIVIATGPRGGEAAPPNAPVLPPRPPMPPMGAMPPPGMPPGGPPMPPGVGGPPPMPMPMPRRSGGRVANVAHTMATKGGGAGGGLGRLEKIEAYGDQSK